MSDNYENNDKERELREIKEAIDEIAMKIKTGYYDKEEEREDREEYKRLLNEYRKKSEYPKPIRPVNKKRTMHLRIEEV